MKVVQSLVTGNIRILSSFPASSAMPDQIVWNPQ